MEYKITIPGRLPGLNEYIAACNKNYHAGNTLKKQTQELIQWASTKLVGVQLCRIQLVFHWIEKDRRRDKDNIASAKKFILDALQEKGVLKNDGWKQIAGFEDQFSVDSKNPRVEVTIKVLVDGQKELDFSGQNGRINRPQAESLQEKAGNM